MTPTDAETQAAAELEFYRRMVLIRTVEARLLDLFSRGLIRGTIHTCLGQEACAVGVLGGIRRECDLVFSNHRAHGHFLAYCDDVEGLIAEVMGRPQGICGGIGGSQHLYKMNFYTNGVQGGMVPAAVGAALAEKMKQSGALTIAFLGDGTMGQGIVYEGLNLASLWNLPLLFVLEDNQYAQSTPKRLAHAGELTRRAEPFGIAGSVVEGDDPLEIRRATAEARAYAVTRQRPYFLTLNTYRLGPHSKGDDTRSPEELAFFRARDPLARLAAHVPPEERQRADEAARQRVETAVQAALPAAPQAAGGGPAAP